MIARAMLMARQSFSLDMPVIPNYRDVLLPTAFEATYDPGSASYRFAFPGFPTPVGAR